MKTILDNILLEKLFKNQTEQNATLSRVVENQDNLKELQEVAKSRSNEIVCKIKDFNKRIENARMEVKQLAAEKNSFTNKFKRAISNIPVVDWGVSDEDMNKARDKTLTLTTKSLGEIAELVQESIMFSCCNMAFSQCMLNEFYNSFEKEVKNLTTNYTEANEKATKDISSIIKGILDFHKRKVDELENLINSTRKDK